MHSCAFEGGQAGKFGERQNTVVVLGGPSPPVEAAGAAVAPKPPGAGAAAPNPPNVTLVAGCEHWCQAPVDV